MSLNAGLSVSVAAVTLRPRTVSTMTQIVRNPALHAPRHALRMFSTGTYRACSSPVLKLISASPAATSDAAISNAAFPSAAHHALVTTRVTESGRGSPFDGAQELGKPQRRLAPGEDDDQVPAFDRLIDRRQHQVPVERRMRPPDC